MIERRELMRTRYLSRPGCRGAARITGGDPDHSGRSSDAAPAAFRRGDQPERGPSECKQPLTPGKHTVEFDFTCDGLGVGTLAFNNLSGIGRGGTGMLKVDGREVARQNMERSIPLTLQWDENFDVGADTLTGVDDQDYQPPFAFDGRIEQLKIEIDRPQLSPEDMKQLQAASAGSNRSSE